MVWWALRKVGVEKWLIKIIQSMYIGMTTAVRMMGEESKEFEVKVGVHQRSVLGCREASRTRVRGLGRSKSLQSC